MIQNTDSKESLLKGLQRAADIITSTMGGSGKNVFMLNKANMDKSFFTKDGVTVARNIEFENTLENAGAALLINAANKTVELCGDGTTLTSLLTNEFIVNTPIDDILTTLEEGDKLINDTIEYLKSTTNPIDSANTIYNIALTSCKDQRLAELIKKIFVKIGLQGQVFAEKTENKETYIEYTEGYRFTSPMLNKGFANQDDGTCVLENVVVWVEDDFITNTSVITKILQSLHLDESLFIIAKGFSDPVVKACLHNNHRICLVNIPDHGETAVENIKDIHAFCTDSKVNKVVVTPYEFTLFNNPPKQQIKRRVKQIERKLTTITEHWEITEMNNRIGNLQQKCAVIYVGGVTDKQLNEEYDRIEDAVGAVKSAARMGYVKGAGVHLYEYAETNDLPEWYKNVLRKPAIKILRNANINTDPTFVPYNTKLKAYDNNLIDPVVVLITALENSWSLTKLLTNTAFTLYD